MHQPCLWFCGISLGLTKDLKLIACTPCGFFDKCVRLRSFTVAAASRKPKAELDESFLALSRSFCLRPPKVVEELKLFHAWIPWSQLYLKVIPIQRIPPLFWPTLHCFLLCLSASYTVRMKYKIHKNGKAVPSKLQ